MNFDFDDMNKYLAPQPKAEVLAIVDKIDTTIGGRDLSVYDKRFMDNIRKKTLAEKPLTDKQKAYLAKILASCKNNTYVIRDFRGGYNNKRKATTDDLNI